MFINTGLYSKKYKRRTLNNAEVVSKQLELRESRGGCRPSRAIQRQASAMPSKMQVLWEAKAEPAPTLRLALKSTTSWLLLRPRWLLFLLLNQSLFQEGLLKGLRRILRHQARLRPFRRPQTSPHGIQARTRLQMQKRAAASACHLCS